MKYQHEDTSVDVEKHTILELGELVQKLSNQAYLNKLVVEYIERGTTKYAKYIRLKDDEGLNKFKLTLYNPTGSAIECLLVVSVDSGEGYYSSIYLFDNFFDLYLNKEENELNLDIEDYDLCCVIEEFRMLRNKARSLQWVNVGISDNTPTFVMEEFADEVIQKWPNVRERVRKINERAPL